MPLKNVLSTQTILCEYKQNHLMRNKLGLCIGIQYISNIGILSLIKISIIIMSRKFNARTVINL